MEMSPSVHEVLARVHASRGNQFLDQEQHPGEGTRPCECAGPHNGDAIFCQTLFSVRLSRINTGGVDLEQAQDSSHVRRERDGQHKKDMLPAATLQHSHIS